MAQLGDPYDTSQGPGSGVMIPGTAQDHPPKYTIRGVCICVCVLNGGSVVWERDYRILPCVFGVAKGVTYTHVIVYLRCLKSTTDNAFAFGKGTKSLGCKDSLLYTLLDI